MPRGRPFERVGRALLQVPPGAAVTGGIALTVAAGVFDYATGPDLAPLTFYLAAVAIVGWAGTRWQGILGAVVAGAFWATAEGLNGRDYDSTWLFVWGAATRLVVFLTVAMLLHRTRSGPDSRVIASAKTCPHCGSTDTVIMRMGLVCRGCKRLT